MIVWDVTSMSDAVDDATIRDFSTPKSDAISVAINLRQLFVGTNKNAKIFDFWNASLASQASPEPLEVTLEVNNA